MDEDELKAIMADAQKFEETSSARNRNRKPRRGRRQNQDALSPGDEPLTSPSSSTTAATDPETIDAELFSAALPVSFKREPSARLDASLEEDPEAMTEVERQIAERMKKSAEESASTSGGGRKSGRDVYAEMMRKKKALEEKKRQAESGGATSETTAATVSSGNTASSTEEQDAKASTPTPSNSTPVPSTIATTSDRATESSTPVASANPDSVALASSYKPRAGRRAATAGRRARMSSDPLRSETPPASTPAPVASDVSVASTPRPFTSAGSSTGETPSRGTATNPVTTTSFDPYLASPRPRSPAVVAPEDYSHLPYKKASNSAAAVSVPLASGSPRERSTLSTGGRRGNTAVHAPMQSATTPAISSSSFPSSTSSAHEERLMQTIRAQEQTIAELNNRKAQLINELHMSNMNASEMVGATKNRYATENERDMKRVKHELELKNMELIAERNNHDETRRRYEDRIKVMTMELGYIKSKVAAELEARFQEQQDYAGRMAATAQEQQKMHFERELASLKQAHQHEIDSLRRQALDGAYLKQLAEKIDKSQSAMAQLSTTVQRGRSSLDDAQQKQLLVREQHIREKESKLNERINNHNMLVAAFENLKNEHSDERTRLKEEYARVQQVQRDLKAQSEILRDQLTSERELLQKERSALRNDKETWTIERQQEQSNHEGNKEMVARMKAQLAQSLQEAKTERDDHSRQLDRERMELSTLKRVLDERKRVLDDRHEKLLTSEEECARKFRYVESKMGELAEFGAKIKNQSVNIARSWKKFKRDEKMLENAQRMVDSTQAELTQKFADLDSRQRILDQERAVFERRRLDLLRDQQQLKNSLTTNDRLLRSASALNVHMDGVGDSKRENVSDAGSESNKNRSRAALIQNQLKLHSTLRAAELKRQAAENAVQSPSSVSGLSQSQRLPAASTGAAAIPAWAGRSADHATRHPMASAAPTLDSVFSKDHATGEVNLNQVALDVLLRDMESEATGIQELLRNEDMMSHVYSPSVLDEPEKDDAPLQPPSPVPTTVSSVSLAESNDDAKSVATVLEPAFNS